MPLAALLQRCCGCFLLLVLVAGCASTRMPDTAATARAPALRPAASLQELGALAESGAQFMEAAAAQRRQACAGARRHRHCPAPVAEDEMERITVTGSRIQASDVITHNQEAGVDEGDLVKKLGDRLFVLHQGRLHVIDTVVEGRPALRLAQTLQVATDGSGATTWYDEILSFDGGLLLLGFNWQEEVAELLYFELSAQGRLSQRARYWLRTEDYFSDSNYGARIEGENLLLQLSMTLRQGDLRWPEWSRRDVPVPSWQALAEPRDVHLPLAIAEEPTVHLVLRCPLVALGGERLQCRSTGIIGNSESEFYASASAAYLALSEWSATAYLDPRYNNWSVDDAEQRALARQHRYTAVYRIPFDGSALGVARLEGTPGNQFSFKEQGGGLLAATTRELTDSTSEVLLQRIDPARFGPSLPEHPARAGLVARIPVTERQQVFRFSDRALWIGMVDGFDDQPKPTPLLRQPLDGGPLQVLELAHSADLIEPLGDHVLAGGMAGQAWQLSLLADQPQRSRPLSGIHIPGYESAEDRSHAFNTAVLAEGRVLGLPGMPQSRIDLDGNASSDLLFFRIHHDQLEAVGRFDMQQPMPECEEHCSDWYGNARLLFIGERILGLSGSRMKEARLQNGMLVEVGTLELR